MIALDFPPDGTGRRDQLSAASQFVEIFDDDVGIDDDVAIVQDQRRQFFQRICEYSSLGWPGTTVVGTNSILSIRPSSIAAMRTLRANGEAGEKVSFMRCPHNCARCGMTSLRATGSARGAAR